MTCGLVFVEKKRISERILAVLSHGIGGSALTGNDIQKKKRVSILINAGKLSINGFTASDTVSRAANLFSAIIWLSTSRLSNISVPLSCAPVLYFSPCDVTRATDPSVVWPRP